MQKRYLFIDTSSYIQIGLLDENFEWVHHEVIANKKGAQLIHGTLYRALNDFGLKVQDLEGILLANGPGSYTGIRIGEGVAQILALEGIKVVTLYHYEVPSFCGVSNYKFFEKAFKGEVFCYTRTGESESKDLIAESSFQSLDTSDEHLYHLIGELNEVVLNSVYTLYKKYPKQIFSQVWERGEHNGPYYFRPAEKEFKMTGIKN